MSKLSDFGRHTMTMASSPKVVADLQQAIIDAIDGLGSHFDGFIEIDVTDGCGASRLEATANAILNKAALLYVQPNGALHVIYPGQGMTADEILFRIDGTKTPNVNAEGKVPCTACQLRELVEKASTVEEQTKECQDSCCQEEDGQGSIPSRLKTRILDIYKKAKMGWYEEPNKVAIETITEAIEELYNAMIDCGDNWAREAVHLGAIIDKLEKTLEKKEIEPMIVTIKGFEDCVHNLQHRISILDAKINKIASTSK